MKKVVRLTESDLIRLVKSVINEQKIDTTKLPEWINLKKTLKSVQHPFKIYTDNPLTHKNQSNSELIQFNIKYTDGFCAVSLSSGDFNLFDNKPILKVETSDGYNYLIRYWDNKGVNVSEQFSSDPNYMDFFQVDLSNVVKYLNDFINYAKKAKKQATQK
jgi:hypothetical protein